MEQEGGIDALGLSLILGPSQSFILHNLLIPGMHLSRFGWAGVFLIADIRPFLLEFIDDFVLVVGVLIICVVEIVFSLVLRLISFQLLSDFLVGQTLRNSLLG